MSYIFLDPGDNKGFKYKNQYTKLIMLLDLENRFLIREKETGSACSPFFERDDNKIPDIFTNESYLRGIKTGEYRLLNNTLQFILVNYER